MILDLKIQIIPLLFLVLLGAGCISVNEITAYPVLCEKDKFLKTGDCGNATPLNRTTYRVDKEKQQVLSWMPSVDPETKRYSKCAILSVSQWSCTYDDDSGKFGFSDGKYFQEPVYLPYEVHVTREEWEKYSN